MCLFSYAYSFILYFFPKFHKVVGVDCQLNNAIELMASTVKRVDASTNKLNQSFWECLDCEIRLNLKNQDKPVCF